MVNNNFFNKSVSKQNCHEDIMANIINQSLLSGKSLKRGLAG